MSSCQHCKGDGYFDEVERERGDIFAYEIKRVLCLVCGATGVSVETQMRSMADSTETHRERVIKLKEQWAQKHDRWERIHENARKTFKEPKFGIIVPGRS